MPAFVASRRDDNESGIVKALEQVGASVYRVDAKGIPDLLVGFRRRTFIIEVKGPSGKLTKAQRDFRKNWRGAPVIIAKTNLEALIQIGAVVDDGEIFNPDLTRKRCGIEGCRLAPGHPGQHKFGANIP